MKIEMKVHSVTPGMTPSTVMMGSREVRAQVECLIVELIPVDPTHGGQTLRFVGDEIGPARDLYVTDAVLSVTFKA